LKRLAEIGFSPSDSAELQLRKTVLVLSSTLMASLACLWAGTYAALGLPASAAIPFAYQFASAASIYTYDGGRRVAVDVEVALLVLLAATAVARVVASWGHPRSVQRRDDDCRFAPSGRQGRVLDFSS
jgi:hypothetical protein